LRELIIKQLVKWKSCLRNLEFSFRFIVVHTKTWTSVNSMTYCTQRVISLQWYIIMLVMKSQINFSRILSGIKGLFLFTSRAQIVFRY